MWPKLLKPVVAFHGEAWVRRIGFDALGYPPETSHTTGECQRVIAAVTETLRGMSSNPNNQAKE